MKKLLMLGGSFSQIPAIRCAKELGYYVITCDYLPGNPGHKISDEYVNISTVDKEAVLQFAQKAKIDGISAYASDPAAVTAAYVADKMGLPGTGFEATKTLAEKDLFRTFQKENGFAVPWFFALKREEYDENKNVRVDFPCIVKPVDSAGSKGVTKVLNQEMLNSSIEKAFEFSRAGRVIIENYIESPYKQIHGEGFVKEGELVFIHLGEQNFYNMVPIGTSCPCNIDKELISRAEQEVYRLIRRIGFGTGALNIEIRLGADGKIYILEIGPRSGGNYMPQLIEYSTGFAEVDACILGTMEDDAHIDFATPQKDYVFQYIIGSPDAGTFDHLELSEAIRGKVEQLFLHKEKGDQICNYQNSAGVVGVLLAKFDSMSEMQEYISNIYQHVKVVLEK